MAHPCSPNFYHIGLRCARKVTWTAFQREGTASAALFSRLSCLASVSHSYLLGLWRQRADSKTSAKRVPRHWLSRHSLNCCTVRIQPTHCVQVVVRYPSALAASCFSGGLRGD